MLHHERDWPPCKVQYCCSFFGLATNALNVRNINIRYIGTRYSVALKEKAPDSARVWRMSRLTLDVTADPSRETKFSGANGDRQCSFFPVQLNRAVLYM